MTEAEERAAVVLEAMSWIGTAYHHEGRVKCSRDALGRVTDKGGVDCAQILVGVYHAALPDRVPDLVVPRYAMDQHMHKPLAGEMPELYLDWVMRFGHETDTPRPGDIVLYRWGHAYAHGAIVMAPGWPSIVHANASSRAVVRDTGTFGRLLEKPKKFFTLW